jgi:hypothetical protein
VNARHPPIFLAPGGWYCESHVAMDHVAVDGPLVQGRTVPLYPCDVA